MGEAEGGHSLYPDGGEAREKAWDSPGLELGGVTEPVDQNHQVDAGLGSGCAAGAELLTAAAASRRTR